MPQALALLWQMLDDKKLASREKYALTLDFDQIFGLDFRKSASQRKKIPAKVQALVKKREGLRAQKKWAEADKIRQQVAKLGWQVEDDPDGPKIKRIKNS